MISADTIASVKERTDLVALIGENVRLTRAGRSFKGLCPFHKEKSPSFHVNPDRGFFHCFGCQEHGTAVDFVMKVNGLDFRESIVFLAERAGIVIEEINGPDAAREAGQREEKDALFAVNHLAAQYFEEQLAAIDERSPSGHALAHVARAEIARRGLVVQGDDEDAHRVRATVAAFRLGYAPYGWDGLASYVKRQGVSPLIAERAGLLMKRASGTGHYDRFRHRLMFAVVDHMGRVVAFSGRALAEPSLEDLERAGAQSMSSGGPPAEPPAKYVNSPESPIYTKGEHLFGLFQARQAIRTRGETVLVEGNFDVFSLHARGLDHVCAPLGTAFTQAQAKLCKRFAPRVIVLFDGDAAGRKATRAARQPCREGQLEAKVGLLPKGLDPDDFVRTRGAAALEQLLRESKGMLEHMLEEALDPDAFGNATMTERIARVRAAAKLIAQEDDPNIRGMTKRLADQLSRKLFLGGQAPEDLSQLERLVDDAFREVPQERGAPRRLATPRDRSLPQWDARAREILGALLDLPELLDDPDVWPALSALSGDEALTLAALRQSVRPGNKPLAADEFLAHVPPSIHFFASGRLASPSFDAVATAKAVLLENAINLKNQSLSRENHAAEAELRTHNRGSRELDEPATGGATNGGPVDRVADENELLREIAERAKQKRGLA